MKQEMIHPLSNEDHIGVSINISSNQGMLGLRPWTGGGLWDFFWVLAAENACVPGRDGVRIVNDR
jgi:hypothetical protein